jgi:hypothetical protein
MLGVLAEQVGDGCLDRGQWAAQVVGDRREQGAADVLGATVGFRLGGGVQQPVAFQHQHELVAEGPQHAAFGPV